MGQTSKMFVRFWNIDERKWELLKVGVPGCPKSGPRDSYIVVDGMRVKPDAFGNYTEIDYSNIEVDAVHAFASARLTIDFWERVLERKIKWPWGWWKFNKRLHIDLSDPMVSGLFKRELRSIIFGTYGSNCQPTRKSFDIVSHETTHAIMYALHEKSMISKLYVSGRLEAFCDISPMLVLLATPEMANHIVGNHDFDHSLPNPISEFAEGFGNDQVLGVRSGLSPNLMINQHKHYDSNLVHKVYSSLCQTISSSTSIEELPEQMITYAKNVYLNLFES